MGRKTAKVAARSKKSGSADADDHSKGQETCALCAECIIESQDALFCEGNCQQWIHRYCAGVSKKHYDGLGDSSPPFLCYACYVEAQRKLVGNLEAAISTLTAEIVELRKAVSERMESTDDSKSSTESWATVARRGGKQTTLKHANGTNTHRFRANSTGSRSSSNVAISASSNVCRSKSVSVQPRMNESASNTRPKVRVEGKRKVWGTLRTTTASAISNTIKALTNVEGLSIRRKFSRGSRSSRIGVSKWWYIISGEESMLDQLCNKWSVVKLQTNWSLEPVFAFTDSESDAEVSQPQVTAPVSQSSENVEKPELQPPTASLLPSPPSPTLSSQDCHSPSSPSPPNDSLSTNAISSHQPAASPSAASGVVQSA